MKTKLIATLLLAVSIFAQDSIVENLGIISKHRALILEPNDNRKDVSKYVLEFIPRLPPTNKVRIVSTNKLLTITDLLTVPHGPAIVGFHTVHSDGSRSPVKLFMVDVRREEPGIPKVTAVTILTNDFLLTVEEVIEARKQMGTNSPPIPNGRNETYGEGIDKMRQDLEKRRMFNNKPRATRVN